jgi:hypothetical protein
MATSTIIPPLTPEQERALDASAGIVQGDTYVILRKDAVFRWFGYDSAEELRRELQPAFDAADRGELSEWDVDEFLARMHGRGNGAD